MPGQIEKFLNKLSPKERGIVKDLLVAVLANEVDHLDVKKLRDRDDIYRVRKGRMRIIYRLFEGKVIILLIERRSDNTYRDF